MGVEVVGGVELMVVGGVVLLVRVCMGLRDW